MAKFLGLFAVLVLALPALGQTPEGATATMSVTTRLVMVPVVVRDKHGALMNDLKRENFTVRVDGKSQALRYFDHDAAVPLTLGLLIDTSMSQRTVLEDERTASAAFLNKMLSPADKAFVEQFDIRVLLLQDVTAERPKLEDALKKVDVPHPAFSPDDDMEAKRAARRAVIGTKLFDAVVQSSQDITGKLKGRRALILLTDGGDYHSEHSLADAIEASQRADTVVYAIYYTGPAGGPIRALLGAGGGGYGILEHLTGETGGKVFEVTGKQSVEQIYGKIADELRGQYRLGFTPASLSKAGYHHVEVAITGPEAKVKHVVQTRDGFYTEGDR